MKVFQKEYQKFLKGFEPAFRKTLESYQKDLDRIYPKNLFSYFREFALRPSKRLRPFLVYLGYQCGGGKNNAHAIQLGTAMELLHASLLLQDDVIDRSLTRRGHPTFHEVQRNKYLKYPDSGHYGESTAVVTSDLGIHIAYHLVAELQNNDVERNYLTMFLETGVGEQVDIDLGFLKDYLDLKKMEKVLELKSGRYSIDRPLALGLALAGKKSWIPKFLKFSNPLGHVFQVIDDYLGVFGDEKEIGKSADSDLKEGKATLIIYYGLKKANASEKKKIMYVLGNQGASRKDIAEVKNILKKYAEETIKTYVGKQLGTSLKLLNNLPVQAKHKELLKEFALYLAKRTH